MKRRFFLLSICISFLWTTVSAEEINKISKETEEFCVQINKQIQKNWKQPEGKLQGKKCFFMITLENDGELKKIEIQKCDNPEMKIKGLKAIANSLPFPKYKGQLIAIGLEY